MNQSEHLRSTVRSSNTAACGLQLYTECKDALEAMGKKHLFLVGWHGGGVSNSIQFLADTRTCNLPAAPDRMNRSGNPQGKTGSGARMKLVVNMVMGSMMNAFSEGVLPIAIALAPSPVRTCLVIFLSATHRAF